MFNVEDPVISRTEKFGSRAELENPVLYCKECGELKNSLYDDYYTDKRGNAFCCEACAIKYYGIRLVEV